MLILDEPEATARDRFHGGCVSAHELARDPLLSRWQRVARVGLRADSAAYAEGVSDSELATRRQKLEDVFREESALLGPIAADFASRSLVAVVADPEGVILAAHGGGDFVSAAARSRLVEGATWSETVRGTNAIGTALAERAPVAVVGGAHYEIRNARLFCYASPVRDAYGKIACVLDVTGSIDHHDRSVAVAVKASAMGLERALRMRAFATSGMGGLPVLERLVRRCSTPAFIVEASGDVRIVNEAARDVLGQGGARLDCTKIFGVDYAELVALALAGDLGRFETPHATFGVELDIVAGERGALAVLVYLQPAHAHVRAAHVAGAAMTAAPRTSHPAFARVLGSDPALERAKSLTVRFAATALPVLLLAETGTGKELFARAIHDASPRSSGPFLAVNCGALTASLLESELFGHAPGAFTGAHKRGADGKIAAADGGTLFLDELAEMPESLQATLLRVLDDGIYYRVGDSRPRRSNFRLVCATCRDLPALVEAGKFRRDLFFRIHGATVRIPPLRMRTDRVELARALLDTLTRGKSTLSADAVRWIEEHDWPGNVRELKTALAHCVALTPEGEIRRGDFPDVLVSSPSPSSSSVATPRGKTRDAIVREAVEEALRSCDGNLSEAARRLGVARSTVYRMLRQR